MFVADVVDGGVKGLLVIFESLATVYASRRGVSIPVGLFTFRINACESSRHYPGPEPIDSFLHNE